MVAEDYDHLLRLNVPPAESTDTPYHSAVLVGGNDDVRKRASPNKTIDDDSFRESPSKLAVSSHLP